MADRALRATRLDERRERARPVLALVEQVVGTVPGTDADDPHERLLAAETTVERAAVQARADGDAKHTLLLAALSEQVRSVRTTLAEQIGADRAVSDVRRALGRLRTITSVPELVARAPGELGRLGYTRVLLSRVAGGDWVTRSAYADRAPELATELVAAGQARPRRLNASLLETEMVRRRRPMLVTDPQDSPYTHRELVAITMTQAYVAAPLIGNGDVVGLLHADKDADAGRVSELDQEVLGSFAEGFGLALERAVSLRRLTELRSRLATQLSTVTDLIDEFAGAESLVIADHGVDPMSPDPMGRAAVSLDPVSAGPPRTMGPAARSWGLTRRELDVLEELAAGKSNSQIAAGLFVSETTVKYHVKNVLRKMHAANRADAVARYYQAR